MLTALSLAALAGLVTVLAAAHAVAAMRTRTPNPASAPAAIEPELNPAAPPAIPALLLGDARPALGYLHGHRHQIEVVEVGPAAVEVHTARAFQAMYQAAAERGLELTIESGFRTSAEQLELYRAWRHGDGNRAARPGRSNHQSGRALDLTVSNPEVRHWLASNAAHFGFRRTVRGEPWHYEYVRVPRARGRHRHRHRHHRGRAGHRAQAARTAGHHRHHRPRG